MSAWRFWYEQIVGVLRHDPERVELAQLKRGWYEQIVASLRAAGWDNEDIVLWLAAPHGTLGRRSPIEALDAGDWDLVLTVVEEEIAGIW